MPSTHQQETQEMKRIFGWIVAPVLMAACVNAVEAGYPHGHAHGHACRQCNNGGHFGLFGGLGMGGYRFADGGYGAGGGMFGHHYAPPGPMTPTVVYPYYTVRGPRDFLAPNPRGIGP
jgi:hypothetical protein